MELHVGDRVPADLRVIQLRTATVRAEQASLTGAFRCPEHCKCSCTCCHGWPSARSCNVLLCDLQHA